MSLNRRPVDAFERPANLQWDTPHKALAKWATSPSAAEADDANTISIYDIIGEGWDGSGFTSARMAAALRAIGDNPVTVNINSPGGDMFEGLAIYNLLAEHPAEVTVKVMGLAASAASIIAMAGDKVLMGNGTMIMVHRAWGLAIGNHNDFTEAADLFQKFDESMASIYEARTGLSGAEIFSLLNGKNKSSDGTFMNVAEAIEKGFADDKFERSKGDGKAKNELPSQIVAKRRIEAALAAQGVSRKERLSLISEIQGESDSAAEAMRDAGEIKPNDDFAELAAALVSNTTVLKGGRS